MNQRENSVNQRENSVHHLEGRLMVAPVFHELTWKLDRIPLHPVYPTHQAALLRGEHVLQGVAKLVEEGLDLGAAYGYYIW